MYAKVIQLYIYVYTYGTLLVAQMVKNPSVMQEIWVWSLGWEDPLEMGMATHSSILTWRIPWTEEAGGLQSTGSQKVGHDWVTNAFTFQVYIYIPSPAPHSFPL